MAEKALVVIPEIDFKGGGERVSYKAAQTLAENDVELDILTNAFFTGKENVEKELYETYGHSEEFKEKLDNIYTVESPKIKKFVKAKYKEAYQWFKASKLHEKNNYDYIFTHYSNLHFMPEFEDAEVVYYIGPGPENEPGLKRKILEKTYLTPYWATNKLVERSTPPENYTFVANSNYSKRKFSQKFSKIDFERVHPPVDTENFQYDGEEKEKMIVNFSRISPGKRNHLLIEVADKLGKELEEYSFKIIGAVRESERRYLEEIEEKIEEKGLKDKIDIESNLEFEDLTDLLKKSEINLHFAQGESFGMTPVESLAAGNELVVHKSGAPWHDIVKKGKYGKGWENKQELVQKVKQTVLEERKTEKNIKRAQDFSESKFKGKIKGLFGL